MRDRKKKPPAMKEGDLHAFTVDLLRTIAKPYVLWLHIPMGVMSKHGRMAGVWAKKMGARPGAPDFLLIKNGRVVFLELKVRKGVLSSDQKTFALDAVGAGAEFHVARTPEQVKALLHKLGMIRAATLAA
jgi:hypothetical protein